MLTTSSNCVRPLRQASWFLSNGWNPHLKKIWKMAKGNLHWAYIWISAQYDLFSFIHSAARLTSDWYKGFDSELEFKTRTSCPHLEPEEGQETFSEQQRFCMLAISDDLDIITASPIWTEAAWVLLSVAMASSWTSLIYSQSNSKWWEFWKVLEINGRNMTMREEWEDAVSKVAKMEAHELLNWKWRHSSTCFSIWYEFIDVMIQYSQSKFKFFQ